MCWKAAGKWKLCISPKDVNVGMLKSVEWSSDAKERMTGGQTEEAKESDIISKLMRQGQEL
jgi:hypothetical protein